MNLIWMQFQMVNETFIGGIMQHIEEAGIHSGDSSCVIPPFRLSTRIRSQMVESNKKAL